MLFRNSVVNYKSGAKETNTPSRTPCSKRKGYQAIQAKPDVM